MNGEPIQETAIDLIDSEPQVRERFREESLVLSTMLNPNGMVCCNRSSCAGLEIGSKSSSAGAASWRPKWGRLSNDPGEGHRNGN